MNQSGSPEKFWVEDAYTSRELFDKGLFPGAWETRLAELYVAIQEKGWSEEEMVKFVRGKLRDLLKSYGKEAPAWLFSDQEIEAYVAGVKKLVDQLGFIGEEKGVAVMRTILADQLVVVTSRSVAALARQDETFWGEPEVTVMVEEKGQKWPMKCTRESELGTVEGACYQVVGSIGKTKVIDAYLGEKNEGRLKALLEQVAVFMREASPELRSQFENLDYILLTDVSWAIPSIAGGKRAIYFGVETTAKEWDDLIAFELSHLQLTEEYPAGLSPLLGDWISWNARLEYLQGKGETTERLDDVLEYLADLNWRNEGYLRGTFSLGFNGLMEWVRSGIDPIEDRELWQKVLEIVDL